MRSSLHRTAAISLDVEKAFDSVWHDGLRYKLYSTGLPDSALRFLSSFLQNRSIQVRVNGTLSQPVPLLAGTPQGSVISPLLFNIYVNDLSLESCQGCRGGGQFADDISAWTTAKTDGMRHARLQRTLDHVMNWCAKWRVQLTPAKTQYLVFKQTSRTRVKPLILYGQPINASTGIKILGVKFDAACTMMKHCREKAVNANKRINLLRMIAGRGWGASAKTLLNLYKQFIRPVMEYGAVTTAGACKSAITQLEVTERRALRFALRPLPGISNSELYGLAGITPLGERLKEAADRAISKYGRNRMTVALETTKATLSRSAVGM